MKKLTDLIAPAFHTLHNHIKHKKYVHYWLKGGRGSTKSSFASIELILQLLKHPNTHACILRKHYENLRSSVYSQIIWAIDQLGLTHLFKFHYSPLTITYTPTQQKIMFRGVDDATKLKSLKPRFGYCAWVWLEEINEFSGIEEIRNVLQSLVRGGDDFTVFYSYNPPEDPDSWVNSEADTHHPSRIVHHSTYLQVPAKWLGKQFIADAEQLKKTKPAEYEHEYLGVPNSKRNNTVVKYFSSENIQEINYFPDETLHWSLDFNVDPAVSHTFHKTDREMFYFDEITLENCCTQDVITEFINRYGDHRGKIIINGDASGDYRRSESEYTNYAQVMNRLIAHFGYDRVELEIRGFNPPIQSRVNAFNQLVYSDKGERRLFISPKCKYLIYNCKKLKYKPGTSIIYTPTPNDIKKDNDLKYFVHPFDSASYPAEYYFPITYD